MALFSSTCQRYMLVVLCTFLFTVLGCSFFLTSLSTTNTHQTSCHQANSHANESYNTKPKPYWSPLHATKEQWFEDVLDRYIEYHNNVTAGLLPQKYAGCSLAHGYGNVWQQFVSCMLYAIMSRRALLLDYRGWDMNNPFMKYFDELFLPPPIQMYNYNKTHIQSLQHKKTWNAFGDIESFVVCFNMTEFAKDLDVIGLSGQKGYDYFGGLLRQNPYHQMMHQLPTNYYQLIFRKFLKLHPTLQVEVDRFKAAHFGKYNIALQVRIRDYDPNPEIPLDLFLQAAELLSAQTPYTANETVFFVVTKNATHAYAAQHKYGKEKIIYYDGPQDRSSKAGNFVAFLTMWLMGECDDVITSEWSSYGTNAAARTGIIPVVCTHMRYCFRRLTPTPCTYNPYPVKEACPKSQLDINRFTGVESHCMFMETYIRNCVNYGCPNPYNSWPEGWRGKPIPSFPPSCPSQGLNQTKKT